MIYGGTFKTLIIIVGAASYEERVHPKYNIINSVGFAVMDRYTHRGVKNSRAATSAPGTEHKR
jgi:hypothetical protein